MKKIKLNNAVTRFPQKDFHTYTKLIFQYAEQKLL